MADKGRHAGRVDAAGSGVRHPPDRALLTDGNSVGHGIQLGRTRQLELSETRGTGPRQIIHVGERDGSAGADDYTNWLESVELA